MKIASLVFAVLAFAAPLAFAYPPDNNPTSLVPEKPGAMATIAATSPDDDAAAEANPPFGLVGKVMEIVLDHGPFFATCGAVVLLTVISWAARNL